VKSFGWPRDEAAWVALGVGLLALGVVSLWGPRLAAYAERRPRSTLALLSALAGLLSFGYVVHYLRGGPRIIDATSYFLEARALARGAAAFPLLEPVTAFRGRFLLNAPGASEVTVLFPPGYPALLALALRLGAPMALGPLLAVALTASTHALARELFQRKDVALVAAGLSLGCAALRYHTADTMSHGLAAVLCTAGLAAVLRGGGMTSVGGLLLGWLVATRPVTGAVALAFALWLVRRRGKSELLALLLALAPGLGLLAWHQLAATGTLVGSSQLRYYALADGPPGCFRYGFGSGIGCWFEHGDFVRAHLADGYGFRAALGTTGRRLWMHFGDLANAWPLFSALVLAAWTARREPSARLALFVPLALIAAYAPFYFDGNYPGGGARFYAEALPFEHALLAFGLVRSKVARFAPGALLLAFALHASRAHEALRDREGGWPMFELERARSAGVERGLLFVNTDHGFNLAHVPGARDPARELVVARYRGDARDFLLWDSLGRPPAHRYVFDASGKDPPSVTQFEPARLFDFDGGASWPPLEVYRGWTHPDFPGASCAEGRYGLRFRDRADVTLEVGSPASGPQRITTTWVGLAEGEQNVEVEAHGLKWAASWSGNAGGCFTAVGPPMELTKGAWPVRLRTSSDTLVLASIAVRPAGPSTPSGNSVDN